MGPGLPVQGDRCRPRRIYDHPSLIRPRQKADQSPQIMSPSGQEPARTELLVLSEQIAGKHHQTRHSQCPTETTGSADKTQLGAGSWPFSSNCLGSNTQTAETPGSAERSHG